MIINGDSYLELMNFPDNYFDACVTDPPYGLKFMGKHWDYDVPAKCLWEQILRTLKPGGHLLSFFGTRTYHRGVTIIEDAGFEIRDQIQWIYGSGFPKSHNIGEGRGTALKPANEPIVLARKPLAKGLTVAQNVSKHGTGALNIDVSRIGYQSNADLEYAKAGAGRRVKSGNENDTGGWKNTSETKTVNDNFSQGRWPANIILDEEAAALLGEPSRFFYVAKASKSERNAGLEGMPLVKVPDHADGTKRKLVAQAENYKNPNLPRANHHPTVKPIKLMEYLCKLITPPTGIILDPFCGSGSTGVAAIKCGYGFVGIEREKEYCEIADKRIEATA